MNKRQIKLSCYLEQLNIEVVKVEMILNQLNRLKNNLKSFGIIVDNSRNAVLNKSEELIINKGKNTFKQ